MALTRSDRTVIRQAIATAKARGEHLVAIRTAALVELGGAELLSDAERAEFENTPAAQRAERTAQVAIEPLAELVEAEAA